MKVLRGVTTTALWLVAAMLGLALVVVRYRGIEGFGAAGFDFWRYYVPAARSLAEIGTPYSVVGYVYSPLAAFGVQAALATPQPLLTWSVLQLACALGSVAAAYLAFRPVLDGWRGPSFVAAATLTLLWSWTTGLEVALGQVDLVVLLCISLAVLADARGRPGLAGVALGVGALLKTWPAFAAVWLLRRGARGRWRSVGFFVGTGVLGAAVFAILLGPGILSEWVRSTGSGSVQPVLSYSAFGLGRELFYGNAAFVPVVQSPVLRWTVTVTVALLVLALVLLVLRRPGPSGLAMWHVVGCGLLLQPVSHLNYLVLLVPIVWHYIVRALQWRRGRRPRIPEMVAGVVVVAWWMVAHRTFDQSRGGYLLTCAATIVMLTVSITVQALSAGEARPLLEDRDGWERSVAIER